MKKKWTLNNEVSEKEIEELIKQIKTDKITAKLLLQRKVKNKDDILHFFKPDLSKLHDPFLMKDMNLAVNRVIKAYKQKENVMLYGDYDVDGTTAVSLLFNNLNEHLNLTYYIPDRFKEGYGISKTGIDYAISKNINLIISLDCGIKSKKEIAYAKKNNIGFIVCDHHEVGDDIPTCIILNPKQKNCNYPFEGLSGCGVGFKLLEGIYKQFGWDKKSLFSHLELVAISIAADMVPISNENRILAFHGLSKLNSKPIRALKEMILSANRTFPVNMQDILFSIAPRINAVGRLRNGMFAVEFLTTDNEKNISSILIDIQKDNEDRKKLDEMVLNEALEKIIEIKDFSSLDSTILFDKSWHKGVLGIVASKLIENHHYQPTIILNEEHGILSGSARSIEGINIYEAIYSCRELLIKFGGHANAAGLSIKVEKFKEFADRIDTYIKSKKKHNRIYTNHKHRFRN
ncbi:MAG: single-stranded-DNA-specific exonuclease RecJ [Crocinitomicaceae bacterium]|nr:single-stranded-DNA-specific exonuclease RecJ [Crocinitomicaceae bacterium]